MKEIFKILQHLKLTANQLCVLIYFKDKEAPPISNIHTERRHLLANDWIDQNNNLTAKAVALVSSIDIMIKMPPNIVNITPDKDNIDKYLEIFPTGKLPSGKPARCSKLVIQDQFRWFFSKYQYSWEVVLQATRHYVTQYKSKGWLYMRNSQYFISKTGQDKVRSSDLADYCELVLTGDIEDNTNHFSEKVV